MCVVDAALWIRVLVFNNLAVGEAACISPLLCSGDVRCQHVAHTALQDHNSKCIAATSAKERRNLCGEAAVAVGRARGSDGRTSPATEILDVMVLPNQTTRKARIHIRRGAEQCPGIRTGGHSNVDGSCPRSGRMEGHNQGN